MTTCSAFPREPLYARVPVTCPDRSRTLVVVDEAISKRLLLALGQRIRELRAQQGYSQEAFVDKCGVHRTFMGTVERGESNLSFGNIARVAATLGVTPSTLFQGLEAESSHSRRRVRLKYEGLSQEAADRSCGSSHAEIALSSAKRGLVLDRTRSSRRRIIFHLTFELTRL